MLLLPLPWFVALPLGTVPDAPYTLRNENLQEPSWIHFLALQLLQHPGRHHLLMNIVAVLLPYGTMRLSWAWSRKHGHYLPYKDDLGAACPGGITKGISSPRLDHTIPPLPTACLHNPTILHFSAAGPQRKDFHGVSRRQKQDVKFHCLPLAVDAMSRSMKTTANSPRPGHHPSSTPGTRAALTELAAAKEQHLPPTA